MIRFHDEITPGFAAAVNWYRGAWPSLYVKFWRWAVSINEPFHVVVSDTD